MGAAQPWAARAFLTPRAPSTAFTTGELDSMAQRGTASLLARASPSSAPLHLPPPPATSPSLHPPHVRLCPRLRGSPCSLQARPQDSLESMASVTPVSSYSAGVLWHPEPLGVPYVPGYAGDSASKMLFTDASFEDDVPPAPMDAFHCEVVSWEVLRRNSASPPAQSVACVTFSRGSQAWCSADPSTAGLHQEERYGGASMRMGKADLAPRGFSTGHTHDTCFLFTLRLVWMPVGARKGRWTLCEPQ